MLARPLIPRALLAIWWLIAAACPALLASGRREAAVPGVYLGHAPAKDAARRVFTLSLDSDGTAILTTQYIGKNDAIQHGRWTHSGSQIVLTFDPIGPNGPLRPITFRHRDHELSPVHWDPNEWGRAGPPVLHLSHVVQGGL